MIKVDTIKKWQFIALMVLFCSASWAESRATKPTQYRYCYQSFGETKPILLYAKAVVVSANDSLKIYITRPWVENLKDSHLYHIVTAKKGSTYQSGSFNTRSTSLPIIVAKEQNRKNGLVFDLKFSAIEHPDFKLYLLKNKIDE